MEKLKNLSDFLKNRHGDFKIKTLAKAFDLQTDSIRKFAVMNIGIMKVKGNILHIEAPGATSRTGNNLKNDGRGVSSQFGDRSRLSKKTKSHGNAIIKQNE